MKSQILVTILINYSEPTSFIDVLTDKCLVSVALGKVLRLFIMEASYSLANLAIFSSNFWLTIECLCEGTMGEPESFLLYTDYYFIPYFFNHLIVLNIDLYSLGHDLNRCKS